MVLDGWVIVRSRGVASFSGLDPDGLRNLSQRMREAAEVSENTSVDVQNAFRTSGLPDETGLLGRMTDRSDQLLLVADELHGRAGLAEHYQLNLSGAMPPEVFGGLESYEPSAEALAAVQSTVDRDRSRLAELQAAYLDATRLRLPDSHLAPIRAEMRELEGRLAGKGDLGGTYESETRSDFYIPATDPVERGRAALISAMTDTADPAEIQRDEFKVIDHGDGVYTVVLAGVIDLSSPHIGLDPDSRSVRDVDQHATRSATSTDLEDNQYGQMVREWMQQNLPDGSKVMVVGHSYGGDTAFDLAANAETIRNEDGIEITHAVAVAYNTGHQFGDIPSSVASLSVRNDADAAVFVERAGEGANEVAVGVWDTYTGDTPEQRAEGRQGVGLGVLSMLNDTMDHANDAQRAPGRIATNEDVQDFVITGGGDTDIDYSQLIADAGGFESMQEGVTLPGPNQVDTVFSGGFQGAGHHQDNYNSYLASENDTNITGYFESIDQAGYTRPGTSVAVDVSVPED